MKIYTKFIIPYLLMLSIAFTFYACKEKSGCTDPLALNFDPEAKTSSGDCKYSEPTPVTGGKLKFHFHQTFGINDIDTAGVYTINNGQKFTLQQIRYYISNVRMVQEDGAEFIIPESYLLVQPSVEYYVMENAKPGTYTKLKFNLGIDSASNSAGIMPTDRPAGHPLGIQSPSMFWTWASGYIFMRLEGIADTLGGGGLNTSLSYHVGSNDLLREVEIPVPGTFEIKAGSETVLHLKADFRELFRDMDFRTERMTHTMGNMPLAIKIADKASQIFDLSH